MNEPHSAQSRDNMTDFTSQHICTICTWLIIGNPGVTHSVTLQCLHGVATSALALLNSPLGKYRGCTWLTFWKPQIEQNSIYPSGHQASAEAHLGRGRLSCTCLLNFFLDVTQNRRRDVFQQADVEISETKGNGKLIK